MTATRHGDKTHCSYNDTTRGGVERRQERDVNLIEGRIKIFSVREGINVHNARP
jgi:hypothetical protein